MIMSARDVLIKTSAIAAGIIPSEIIPLCNGKKVVTIERCSSPEAVKARNVLEALATIKVK